jgi:Uma2 family endonuclease
MDQNLLLKPKKVTYYQYLKINDDKRYEIIKGELFMSPAPNTKHQRIIKKLTCLIEDYLIQKKDKGEIFISPIDVVFSEEDVLQPDIVYVSEKNQEIIQERGIFGVPDIVIEVISSGSERTDLLEKKRIYEEYKVKEYWIVFPREEFIVVWEYKEELSRYVERGVYIKEKELESGVIDGLKIGLKEVF